MSIIKKIIAIFALGGTVAFGVFALNDTEMITVIDGTKFSDIELKKHIENQIVEGCLLMVNPCISECKKKIPISEISTVCPNPSVIRISTTKIQDIYFELGRDYGFEVHDNMDKINLPYKIRAELGKTRELKPIKEKLSYNIYDK